MTALDVAFAGVVATGLAGFASALITSSIAKRNRSHERQLALDERVYARRADSYHRYMTYLNELAAYLDSLGVTTRVFSDKGASNKDLHELDAAVTAFGSEDVVGAAKELISLGLEITLKAATLEILESQKPTMPFETEKDELWKCREQFKEQLENVSALMRTDLTELPEEKKRRSASS